MHSLQLLLLVVVTVEVVELVVMMMTIVVVVVVSGGGGNDDGFSGGNFKTVVRMIVEGDGDSSGERSVAVNMLTLEQSKCTDKPSDDHKSQPTFQARSKSQTAELI